jgi:hypothetical protein
MEKRTSSSTPQEDIADDTSNSGRKEPRRNISRACEPCRQRKVKVSVSLRGFAPVIRTRTVLWLTVICNSVMGKGPDFPSLVISFRRPFVPIARIIRQKMKLWPPPQLHCAPSDRCGFWAIANSSAGPYVDTAQITN